MSDVVQRYHTCPDCKSQFVQPFTCTTCGAQRLYDETVRSQSRLIEQQAAVIAELTLERDEYANCLDPLTQARAVRSLKARADEWCRLYAKARDQRDRLRKKLRQLKAQK